MNAQISKSDILFSIPLRSLSSTFSHKAVNFLSTPVSTGVLFFYTVLRFLSQIIVLLKFTSRRLSYMAIKNLPYSFSC